MIIYFTLISKLIPLYLIIFLGFLAGKYLKAQKETLASILIYIIAPIIIFHGVVSTPITLGIISIPILFFIVCSFMCLLFFSIAKKHWQDTTSNILAYMAGSGNAGYFGLPVAVAILVKI